MPEATKIDEAEKNIQTIEEFFKVSDRVADKIKNVAEVEIETDKHGCFWG